MLVTVGAPQIAELGNLYDENSFGHGRFNASLLADLIPSCDTLIGVAVNLISNHRTGRRAVGSSTNNEG